MITDGKAEQPLNASEGIVFIPVGMLISEFNEEQPENAPKLSSVRLVGILIFVRDEQL